jgi:hypothetical protein
MHVSVTRHSFRFIIILLSRYWRIGIGPGPDALWSERNAQPIGAFREAKARTGYFARLGATEDYAGTSLS